MSDLDKAIKNIKKDHGENSIRTASEKEVLEIPRISTGVFTLDAALGGGIPAGRMMRIHGPESSGKSTIASMSVAQAQMMCRYCYTPTLNEDDDCTVCEREDVGMNIAWTDAEGSFDPEWEERLGVDVDNLYVTEPEFAEEAVDINDRLLDSGDIDLIVVDSVAHLTPKTEIEEDMEDDQMALQARLMNKTLRRWVSKMNKQAKEPGPIPTILLINQQREKVGVTFGDPTTTPGGKGQEFAISVDLRLKKPKYEFEGGRKTPKKDNVADKPKSVKVRFRVPKNKTGPPNRTGSFSMALQDDEEEGIEVGDTNEKEVMWKYADRFELIEKEGHQEWVFNGGEVEAEAKYKLKEKVLSDPDRAAQLRDRLMSILQN